MSESIISVKDLNLWYGQSQALKSISVEIPEHAITALIGWRFRNTPLRR